MAGRVSKLRNVLRRAGRVQESASCARALAGMAVQTTLSELMDVVDMSQALLTARIIHQQGNIPWPMGISRQLDPEDPAFLPSFGAHTPLFAREATALGVSGQSRLGFIDPWGWCGGDNEPMVTVWFSDGNGVYCPGKLPSHGGEVHAEQSLSEHGHGVRTASHQGKLLLEMFHWPITLEGQTAFALVSRVVALADCTAKMAFVIRPVDLTGAHPIFHLSRNGNGEWSTDGKVLLTVARVGQRTLHTKYGDPDLWHLFQSRFSGNYTNAIDVRCGAGQASGAEIYEATLKKGEVLSQFAVISPPKDMPTRLIRTSEHSLWQGAIADKKGLYAASARLNIGQHQSIFDRAQQRLLLDRSSVGLSGCLGCVALARMGYVRLAGERLERWLQQGFHQGWEMETGSILAWAAAEYVLWTKERSWLQKNLKIWTTLLDKLSGGKVVAGGRSLFGKSGSLRWIEIWRIAALLNGVRALRGASPDCQRWGIAGASAQDGLLSFLGEAPWSASPNRAPDGSSAVLLTTGWLRLLPLDTPELLKTAAHLEEHLMHDEGVMLNGGAHLAATSILLAVQKRIDPTKDVVSTIARFASSTGALPTIRHRMRGAMKNGDDPLSAALFCLLVLDDLQVEKGKIFLHGLIRKARDLPTPFGKIDIDDGQVLRADEVAIRYR